MKKRRALPWIQTSENHRPLWNEPPMPTAMAPESGKWSWYEAWYSMTLELPSILWESNQFFFFISTINSAKFLINSSVPKNLSILRLIQHNQWLCSARDRFTSAIISVSFPINWLVHQYHRSYDRLWTNYLCHRLCYLTGPLEILVIFCK